MMPTKKRLLISVFFLTVSFFFSCTGWAAVQEEAVRLRIRGYQTQHRGDLDKAVDLYKLSIAADPAYAAPHNDLGIIYEEKGWHEQAEKEYGEALRLDPKYVDAYSNLALLYEKLQQKEKMIDALKKRIALGAPDDLGTEEAKNKLESLGVKSEPAPSVAAPSPSISPRTKEMVKIVPSLEEKQKKEEKPKAPEEGIIQPEKSETVEAEAPPVKGVTWEGKEALFTEKELDPKQEAIRLRNKGLQFQLNGDYDGAIQFYRAAIEQYPDFATLHNDLGIALEDKGSLEEARLSYLKALSIKQNYGYALYNLAFLLVKMGRRDEAIEFFKKLVPQAELGAAWTQKAKETLEKLLKEAHDERIAARHAEEIRIRKLRLEKHHLKREAHIRRQIQKEVEAKHEKESQELLKTLLDQGKKAYQKKEYDSAQTLFEKMLLLDGENQAAKSYLKKIASEKEAEIGKAKQEKEKEKETTEQKKIEGEKKKAESDALYEEAKKLYREAKYEEAKKRFDKLVVLLPDHPYAKRYLEKIKEKKGEEEEKKKAEEKEKEARRKEIKSHLDEGEKAFKGAKYEQAYQEFETVLSMSPDHKEAKRLLEKTKEAWNRARQNKHLTKEKKKWEKTKRADEKMKKTAQAYYLEGLKSANKGEIDKAIYAYEKTLSYNKDHEKAAKALASLEGKSSRERPYTQTEEKALKPEKVTEPEEGRLYRRAKSAFDAGDYELAKQTLQYLLTLNPEHPLAQGDLAAVEERIRETRQKGGLEKATLKQEAARMVAPARRENGEMGGAAHPSKKEEGPLMRAQGGPEALTGDHLQKGTIDFDETDAVSSLRDKNALIYMQKGYVLQQQRDIESALSFYEKSMAIKPSSNAANSLGILYENKGWYTDAETYYKKALDLDSRYLPAYTNLALLYEHLERWEEAMRYWKARIDLCDRNDLWTQKARTHLEALAGR